MLPGCPSSPGLVRGVPRAWDAPVLLLSDCGAVLVHFGGHRGSRAWLLDRSCQITCAALSVPIMPLFAGYAYTPLTWTIKKLQCL